MMEGFRNNGEEKVFEKYRLRYKIKAVYLCRERYKWHGGRHNKTWRAGGEAVEEWHEEERQNERGKMRVMG